MATVQIDETELANLKRINDVAAQIGNNPKARALLQEAVALAVPEQAGPETHLRKEFSEGLSEIKKELAADREARQKEREEREAAEATRALERRFTESRAKARAAGYTDEGLKSLEDFMEKNGVADHELAIPAFERLNPPAEPVATGGSAWNFFDTPKDDVSMKSLLENPFGDDFLNQAIPAALKDVRGR